MKSHGEPTELEYRMSVVILAFGWAVTVWAFVAPVIGGKPCSVPLSVECIDAAFYENP